MIIEELLAEDMVKHYSNLGVTLLQIETGIEYDEPIDTYPCPYTYEETENKIDGATIEYKDLLQEEYKELKSELQSTETELHETEEELANAEQEIIDTQMALCELYESLELGE